MWANALRLPWEGGWVLLELTDALQCKSLLYVQDFGKTAFLLELRLYDCTTMTVMHIGF